MAELEADKEDDGERGSDPLAGIDVKTTEEIEVPKLLIDQVLGQEHGAEVIKKAAKQRRHVMLIGTPGTGKSMLASSMAGLLPKEELQDILVYPNVDDKNTPKIRVVPRGKGKEIVDTQKVEMRKRVQVRNTFVMFSFFLIIGMGLIYAVQTGKFEFVFWSIIAAAVILLAFRWMMPKEEAMIPKLLVSNYGRESASFVDATGAHSGALLGDVRHDPYQSGGLE
ncbi:ATP-dependent protease LonB, partial [Methanophagales archaeon]